jgi:hypothetical protein
MRTVKDIIAQVDLMRLQDTEIVTGVAGRATPAARQAVARIERYDSILTALRGLSDSADFVAAHVTVTNCGNEYPVTEEQGRKDYERLSRNINATVPSDWMVGWLEGFFSDHPTLQVSLYRSLNEEMRRRHTFVENKSVGTVTCTDGRVSDSLARFVVDGYLPLV